jgi:surfactin synthase thioesterase subunit
MVRIESVIRHYASLLKKPIWLMGHSNGGYSIAEFQRYIAKNGKSDLVQGLIFSAGREEASFTSEVNKPMLFLVSDQDGCGKTSPSSNQRIYERVRQGNKAATEFVWIKSAQAEARDPCYSGIHMYFAAGEEVGRVLDDFLNRHSPSR